MRLQLLCAARCATCNRILYLRSFSTHLLLRGSTQRSPILLHTRPCLAKTQESAIAGIVTMRYERGLPVISIPLPSRREICQFSLKPISDTVFNLCNYLAAEDKGIDFVAFYTIEGTRIAGSTSIEHLLQLGDFRLRINDITYEVNVPPTQNGITSLVELSSERFRSLDDMKATVASLHTIFNIDEFKLDRERKLIEKLEEVELELKPLEAVKARIDAECESHSERIMWILFAAMGLQTGVFARLTWWEYSWDIMEPVTYFATYATVISTYGYYLYTRQNFEYTTMKNRCFTNYFYKRAQKHGFDVVRYNELQDLAEGIRKDLSRLRDPLYQHLPATHLAWTLSENASKHRQRAVDASKNEKT
uniref:Calcium uniporter protein n=2 Tax=Parascaris univalens TaxID=6257 RepID=A0A915B6D1_PARUN